MMAPTRTPIFHPSNSALGRHHRFRRQALRFFHYPPWQSSASGSERSKPRTVGPAVQPSVVLEAPSSPPFASTSSESVWHASKPSATTTGGSQPANVPGILAVSLITVIVLAGLIGLVVGGLMLWRQTRPTGKKRGPFPFTRRTRDQKFKNADELSQGCIKTSNERFPYDEKALALLTRPPPALNKGRRGGRPADVWPIRNLSRVLCSRRNRPEQEERRRQEPAPVANPQTTWSEFASVTLYVPPPRTPLADIPEEHEEDCHDQTNSDAVIGALGRRSSSAASASLMDEAPPPWPSTTKEKECNTPETMEDDVKSLGSSAPDMTLDGDESSRSSMISLESLGAANDRGSLREEAFELRRAQTRSMQINKGILLSLSLKTLAEGGCGPSRPTSAAEGNELSLAMFGGSLSAVDLDEFPSPPSVLPMIPSFVSGF